MKRLSCLLILLLFIAACKKKYEPAIVKIKVSCNQNGNRVYNHTYSKDKFESLHTQFGDHIISITPYKFIGRFQGLCFLDGHADYWDWHMIRFFDEEVPMVDPLRYADFTGGNMVEYTPIFQGSDVDENGVFIAKEVIFKYFLFQTHFFYQEVILPAVYDTIELSQFNYDIGDYHYTSSSVMYDSILKVEHFPIIQPFFPDHQLPDQYIFGNTDSTFLHYCSNDDGYTDDNPFLGDCITPHIRSHKFDAFTFLTPAQGETKTINVILSFDINNLIQIYAGRDNIPYTSDDIIVYAPNYWERISVNVQVE